MCPGLTDGWVRQRLQLRAGIHWYWWGGGGQEHIKGEYVMKSTYGKMKNTEMRQVF